MRTLIVEPWEFSRRGLRQTLEAHGCAVIGTARSFTAAIEMLTTARDVELAFIDLGLEACGEGPAGSALVDLAESRSIPVVVTTGMSVIPDRLKGVALLARPISGEQIATVLASLPPRPDSRH